MTHRLRIRSAAPADLDALLDLGRRTFIDTFAAHNDPADFAVCLEVHYAREKFQRDLADERTLFLVVEETAGGPPLAYARLRWGNAPECVPDRQALEIEKFYVDRPHLGRGIGDMMMRHCLDFARQTGRETVYLSVWEHNARAVRFYQKWGYRKVGEHVFVVGSDPQIDWWMMRPTD